LAIFPRTTMIKNKHPAQQLINEVVPDVNP